MYVNNLRSDTENEISRVEEYLKVLYDLKSAVNGVNKHNGELSVSSCTILPSETPDLSDQIIKMVVNKKKGSGKRAKMPQTRGRK